MTETASIEIHLTLNEVGDPAAASVAGSTVLAERDGIRSRGPIYAEHVACGKVNGRRSSTRRNGLAAMILFNSGARRKANAAHALRDGVTADQGLLGRIEAFD